MTRVLPQIYPTRSQEKEHEMSDLSQSFGVIRPTVVFCKTCKHAGMEPIWGDEVEKGYCGAYRRSNGEGKPAGVLYDGMPCPRWEAKDGESHPN